MYSRMKFLVFIILTTITQIQMTKGQKSHRLEFLDNNQGIYYEAVNTLQLRQSDWKVIIPINTKEILEHYETIPNYKMTLEKCVEHQFNKLCLNALSNTAIMSKNYTLSKIQQNMNETINSLKVNSLSQDWTPAMSRYQRAFSLKDVGKFGKTLFGIATNDDINNAMSHVQQLKKNQQELMHVVNFKTHVLTTALQDIINKDKSQDKVIKRLEKLIEDATNQIYREGEEMTYIMKMNNNLKKLEEKLESEIDSAKRVLEILNFIKEGKCHPSLLSNQKLKQLADDILRTTITMKFPIPVEYLRMEEIAEITTLDVIYQEGHIIVILYLPLVDHQHYQLYRMHSLNAPQKINNITQGVAYIQPSKPYIAIKGDQTQYIKYDHELLSECKITRYGYVCITKQALKDITNTQDCEAALLYQQEDINLNCKIICKKTNITQWKYLLMENAWLFSTSKPEVLKINCPGKSMETITLHGLGIIDLNPGCTGRTADSTITYQSQPIIRQKFSHKLNKPLDLFNSSKLTSVQKECLLQYYLQMKPDYEKGLSEILSDNINTTEIVKVSEILNYSNLVLIFVIIIICSVLKIKKNYDQKKKEVTAYSPSRVTEPLTDTTQTIGQLKTLRRSLTLPIKSRNPNPVEKLDKSKPKDNIISMLQRAEVD